MLSLNKNHIQIWNVAYLNANHTEKSRLQCTAQLRIQNFVYYLNKLYQTQNSSLVIVLPRRSAADFVYVPWI